MKLNQNYLCEILPFLESMFSTKTKFVTVRDLMDTKISAENPKHKPIIEKIINSIINITPIYSKAEISYSENEIASHICRSFSQLASVVALSIQPIIRETPNNIIVLNLLKIVLLCFKSKHFEISFHTIEVWRKLEDIFSYNSPYKTLFIEIFQSSLQHCVYPSNLIKNDENEETLKNFRENCIDIFQSCFTVLGHQFFIEQLINLLKTPNLQWSLAESCIFSFNSVQRLINLDSVKSEINLIFDTAFKISSFNDVLKKTCCQMVTNYKNYISNNQNYIKQSLLFLVSSFNSPQQLFASNLILIL